MENKEELSALRLSQLIFRSLEGGLNPSDQAELQHWLNQSAQNKQRYDELADTKNWDQLTTGLDKYESKTEAALLRVKSKHAKPLGLFKYIAVAASLILVSLVGLYVYKVNQSRPNPGNAMALAEHIIPGSNRATLTLADGSVINLDNKANGEIATQANIKISKTGDGQLVYTTANTDEENASQLYNNINTPKGGQYQLLLPDGTRVWLNAASSLRYPTSFSAHRERRIELDGEAYFEVAKDKAHSFIVKTATQEVEVLGTHFNVNSYANESATITTLEEGSVKVSSGRETKTIRPGQQTLSSNGNIAVQMADMETALAWKNGQIKFKDADIQTIMRQVSRWYNIEVSYEGNIPKRSFNGGISRQSNLATLLKLLNLSNINFEIEQQANGIKKLIVRP